MISPMTSNAEIEDVQHFDPLSKSVAQIEMPINGTGMGKCSGAFIRLDAVITETHCVISENVTHRVLIGLGPGYDQRVIFLTRKIILPKRFQKPDVAILFLQAKPHETVSDRERLVQPIAIAPTSEYAWQVDRPMAVYAFGRRSGDQRLRKHSRIGTVFPWLSNRKVVSQRSENAFIVPGDSGGAAFVATSSGWQLWALVWAIDFENDIFLHLQSVKRWIDRALAVEPLDLKN